MSSHEERKVGRHVLDLSSLDKVLYPESGVTKSQLIDYYEAVSPLMLPHIKDRPLTLRRWPSGIGRKGFFQKEAPSYYPDFIQRVDVVYDKGRVVSNAVGNNAETLVYLTNHNVLEFHLWSSRRDKLRQPDKFIIDLDPHAGADFEMVRQGALMTRQRLDDLGLPSYPMITGSRGIHVVVPLRRTHDFQQVADWTHAFSDQLAEDYPELLTTEFYKRERGDRVFVDWLRN